jgi:hypothetical protein
MIGLLTKPFALWYSLAFAGIMGVSGYLYATYNCHVANIKRIAKQDQQLADKKDKNESLQQLAESQNVFADQRRDGIRIEYRDRMRNIYTMSTDTCPKTNGTDAGGRSADAKEDGRDRVAEIAAEARSGLETIEAKLTNAIEVERAAIK